ncbi:MAG: hypothetical protein K0R31_2127, partial [Clostridiales bacterium]|nr:hypothetical protein [Clostridiales bacterium]
MKPYLSSLLEKVPEDIRLNTQEFISEHIAVFEPKEYSIGQKVYFDHYHFVIPFSTPPLFKIGSREYQFHKKSLLTFKPGMDLTVLPFDSRVRENYISISVS